MTYEHEIDPHKQSVTVVGLGPMGSALAETLLAKGHPLTVWNRTPEKAAGFAAKGARVAPDVAGALAAGSLTVVCLKDYEAMYEAFSPAARELSGHTLVNLNSGTPRQAREAADWAGRHGADYLDGAIMVPPPMVGEPGAVFLYSGSSVVFEGHRDGLASLGDPRYVGDDAGLAVLYNTALLDMMYATMNGWLHATALVGSAGVSAEKFAELALGWFMPTVVDYTALAGQAADVDAANYPGDLGTMEMNRAALDHIALTSVEQGVDSELPGLMARIAGRAVAEGHGAQNFLATYEIFKARSHD
ncbi:MAG: NAD(P)-dependent oxidoreductase [Stackebrandtia sp.]